MYMCMHVHQYLIDDMLLVMMSRACMALWWSSDLVVLRSAIDCSTSRDTRAANFISTYSSCNACTCTCTCAVKWRRDTHFYSMVLLI